jgi:hypothetical protein
VAPGHCGAPRVLWSCPLIPSTGTRRFDEASAGTERVGA